MERLAVSSHGLLECFSRPLIQALAHCLSFDQRPTVHLGWHADEQLARGRFLGRDTLLFAVCKVVLDRRRELTPQFSHGLSVKADDAAKPEHPTDKDVVALV